MANIYDYSGTTYELPDKLKLQIFNDFKNAAILKEGGDSPIFEGFSIIDSVDLHGSAPEAPKVRALILRNGGKVVVREPNGAVA